MIPCHRVLARGGIGGYSGGGGLATKRALLTIEGAVAPFVSLRAMPNNLASSPSMNADRLRLAAVTEAPTDAIVRSP